MLPKGNFPKTFRRHAYSRWRAPLCPETGVGYFPFPLRFHSILLICCHYNTFLCHLQGKIKFSVHKSPGTLQYLSHDRTPAFLSAAY